MILNLNNVSYSFFTKKIVINNKLLFSTKGVLKKQRTMEKIEQIENELKTKRTDEVTALLMSREQRDKFLNNEEFDVRASQLSSDHNTQCILIQKKKVSFF